MKFALVILVAVAAWQLEMAVQSPGRCMHRPRAARVEQAAPAVPASPSLQQCRGPQCPKPTPLPAPVAPSSTR